MNGTSSVVSSTSIMLMPSMPTLKEMPREAIQEKLTANCVEASGVNWKRVYSAAANSTSENRKAICFTDSPLAAKATTAATNGNTMRNSVSIYL